MLYDGFPLALVLAPFALVFVFVPPTFRPD